MAAMPDQPEQSAAAAKSRRIGGVMVLAPLVLLLAVVIIYDRYKIPLNNGVRAAGSAYADWFTNFVASPDNEQARAMLIANVVQAYRDTPVGKSVPLRDDAGNIVGRFRIDEVASMPHRDADGKVPDPTRFDVTMSGKGELWHATGGRVRFEGGAQANYKVSFTTRDWKIYTYFDCLGLDNVEFKITHVDNLLARLFSATVNEAGKKAIREGMKPGFTLISYLNGKTYVAQGRVDRDFEPHPGPFSEDAGWETLCNDVSLLQRDYRDYIGPFDVTPNARVRIDLAVTGGGGREPPGVDLLLVQAADFDIYEDKYWKGNPGPMQDFDPPAVEGRYNTREMKYATTDQAPLPPGTYYLVIDRTRAGRGNQAQAMVDWAAEVKYYARIQR